MIINTINYADFKAAVAMLRHVDGVFYNTSASTPGLSVSAGTPTLLFASGGGTNCFIVAYDIVSEVTVQYVGPNGTPAAGTITTDFPTAVSLNSFLVTADYGTFNI